MTYEPRGSLLTSIEVPRCHPAQRSLREACPWEGSATPLPTSSTFQTHEEETAQLVKHLARRNLCCKFVCLCEWLFSCEAQLNGLLSHSHHHISLLSTKQPSTSPRAAVSARRRDGGTSLILSLHFHIKIMT